MAINKSRPKKFQSITHGRPPLVKSQSASLSSKATRTLIRSHHNLQKSYAQSLKDGDTDRAQKLACELAATGGLEMYQVASTQGQSVQRGGDSSRLLVEWLQPAFGVFRDQGLRLRLLEIGALSTKNACSRVQCLDIKRIDLKSREPGIEEIDFMDMSVPEKGQKFHIISLSLVLNYVPDAASRGAMLARLPRFFEHTITEKMMPSLFFVLPLACVSNSRYLTEERLSKIMGALGFHLARRKTSSKLYYSLWTFDPATRSSDGLHFRKEQLRSGAMRNNFTITLCNGDRKDPSRVL